MLFFPFILLADVTIKKVISIPDGDTLTVINSSNKKIKIRLAGIDAPELKQKYGYTSRDYLRKITSGKKLTYKIHSKDDYGRVVAILYADDKDLNYEMIKAGLAWHYKYYYKSKKYSEAEKNARKEKLGLWQDNNPQAPWDFRRQSKANSSKDKEMEDILKLLIKAVKFIFDF